MGAVHLLRILSLDGGITFELLLDHVDLRECRLECLLLCHQRQDVRGVGAQVSQRGLKPLLDGMQLLFLEAVNEIELVVRRLSDALDLVLRIDIGPEQLG